MKKEIRQQVYNKHNGHCAYCGCELEYKDMQVEHIKPQRVGGTDDIENLIPTCRLCNHYKRGNDLDSFRNWLLGGLIDRIRKIYIVRVAEKYGMVTFHEWDKKFYYENVRDYKGICVGDDDSASH